MESVQRPSVSCFAVSFDDKLVGHPQLRNTETRTLHLHGTKPFDTIILDLCTPFAPRDGRSRTCFPVTTSSWIFPNCVERGIQTSLSCVPWGLSHSYDIPTGRPGSSITDIFTMLDPTAPCAGNFSAAHRERARVAAWNQGRRWGGCENTPGQSSRAFGQS